MSSNLSFTRYGAVFNAEPLPIKTEKGVVEALSKSKGSGSIVKDGCDWVKATRDNINSGWLA